MKTKKKANHLHPSKNLRVRIYGTTDQKLIPAVIQRFKELLPVLTPRLPAGIINIIFTTDRQITRLNRYYLGRNRTTDVLSFPLPPLPVPGLEKERVLGEIYISRQQARRQAQTAQHRLRDELLLLVGHGLLHLAGYSHRQMSRLP
ncbi:MAG: rRNA maturation RNase YbeY [candidate division WOR-3 bacterium]|jgi:probable rRNA maturation factor